ncbi:multidrug efflux SMR transporter [Rhodococcus zopfii]|uniref:Multidrug efflux SMR transporter n=1 Tax=Rhodococcus zopfii TaxID=43772 RepID=A0ABU3WQ92_9NOCA|nr:multidrug efflux SMR transporter [Rhodococcus zopfii]
MTWLILAAAIVVEVTGTICLKLSDGMSRTRWVLATVSCYIVAFGLVASVLARDVPVGVVYGIWVACGVALTAVLGRLLFRDPLTSRMMIGIALIMAGVVVIEVGSHSA